MNASKLQPALLGGLVLGVLSGLPIVNMGNACCCLWVVTGGVTAAYLLQHAQAAPITSGDGAAVGFLAGVFGAIVWQLLAIPVTIMMGPFQARLFERFLSNGDVPENMRSVFESLRQNAGFSIARFVLGSVFTLFISVIFSTVGGVIGAAMFRKKLPPLPPGLPPEPGTGLPGSSY
jgi:hypothetical protein